MPDIFDSNERLELQHYPKKFLVISPGVVRKPYLLVRYSFCGSDVLVDSTLSPCSKHAKGQHQPEDSVNPRWQEELIEME
jgi:hypothetical protein